MNAMALPVSPENLLSVFESISYEVVDEDNYNWLIAKADGVPFSIPKKGSLIVRDVVAEAFRLEPAVERIITDAITGHAPVPFFSCMRRISHVKVKIYHAAPGGA